MATTPTTPSDETPKPNSALSVFKEPPSPALLTLQRRRPKQKVLDEDRYVEKVSDIIARDFFPELEKLEAQREYLEASERNDTVAMNRLRERFSTSSRVRHQQGDGTRPGSPDTFETPIEDRREEQEPKAHSSAAGTAGTKDDDAKSVASSSSLASTSKKGPSLDAFLSKHTSEDNESFNEIMEETHQKFKFTHSWMFKDDEVKSIEHKEQRLALPSIEEQVDRKGNKEDRISRTLDGWTYKNENAVFYPPAGAELSDAELVERAKKERVIVHENTRFKRNPWKTDLRDTSLKDQTINKKEKEAGRVGVDGKTFVRPETPAVNGFKFLRMTPSPMPGAASESPMMTWGEVESTPYRLEGCETPLPMNTSGGPSFSIQDVPKRDRLAYELAEKNSRFYRDKKGKAISKARSNIRTPKMNLTDRVATMSPAAQRLATNKLGIRLGTDKALRASYTPSPARTPSSSTRTPNRSKMLISSSVRKATTPRTPRTPAASSATSASTSAAAAGDVSLTDNLLNLPSTSSSSSSSSPAAGGLSSSKRPKASDYF